MATNTATSAITITARTSEASINPVRSVSWNEDNNRSVIAGSVPKGTTPATHALIRENRLWRSVTICLPPESPAARGYDPSPEEEKHMQSNP